ncbi:MAG: DUF3380 domain-containing protein [Calditrichaeota bacterium]|nr:MAG: DUF3380 domain-containing protein [Calditrichota bacterium]MBL1205258.1 DUF3380 domain-containing protein [Calditrichota bacterium]NOG45087.1 DUF3380 domain-containing protein [Calditrichota bacterium]
MLATVSASALNVRSIPNISGQILGVLNEGSVVDVTEVDNNWLQIPFNDSIGFVSKIYMEIQPQVSKLYGFVNTALLNVRDVPTASGLILGTLFSGTKVSIVSQIPDWLEIEFNNGIGFVLSKYVDLFAQTKSYQADVIAATLNVRQKPDKKAQILGQVKNAMKLTVEADIGAWSEILFNGSSAYVFNKFLKRIEPDEEQGKITVADNADEENETKPEVAESLTDKLQPLQILPVSGTSEQKKVAMTWNRYGGLLNRLSKKNEIDVACAVAVLCVESSGKGFEQNNDNRMIIRFENHKFWKYWGKKNPADFRKHFQYNSDKVWTKHKWRKTENEEWQGFHGNQSKEWQVFEFARSIDADSAMLSISMGAPQIMGFHFERIGYQSIKEMFNSFATDISAHINGLFDFFSDPMVRKLRSLDFEGFAAGYNGSGQKVKYGKWIESHYKSFKQIKS